MLETGLLPHLDVIVDRERQRCRGAQNLDFGGDHLDLTGGDLVVALALRAVLDGAGDLEAVLVAQVVGHRLVADDDLDDAAGLAQVDERDTAMISSSGDPTCECHGLTDMLGTQSAGVVGADHESCSLSCSTVSARGTAVCSPVSRFFS